MRLRKYSETQRALPAGRENVGGKSPNGTRPSSPCENVGAIMGVSKMTVSRYRRWAAEDGLLTLTRQHKFRSGGGGDATEFTFDVSRFPCLREKAQKQTHSLTL